jgi:16S rRNA processing protein RimM
VRGHRGAGGELTVDTHAEDAAPWCAVRRLWIEGARAGEGAFRAVEHSRAYRDRLVVKLEGVNDATAAAALRRREVFVAREDAPALPPGVHWADRLLGLEVVEAGGRALGRVVGLLATGGADLLRVETGEGEAGELLIPMAREIVVDIDEAAGRISVRLPPGLADLNAPER